MKHQNMSTMFSQGRIPPHNVEVEEIIIGSLLLEKEAISQVEDILSEEDFYSPANQILYQTIAELGRAQTPIDLVTVTTELIKRNELEKAGGPGYISGLTLKVTSSLHIREHAAILREHSLRRKAIAVASQIVESSYSGVDDIGELLESSSGEIDSLRDVLIGKSNGKHISDPVKKAIEGMYNRVELARKNVRSGVETGLYDLNQKTNGWQPAELIVLAARPAMGKTALMLHFAKKAALAGVPVAIFSLEMSDVSLANRLLLSESNVDAEKFKSGYLTTEEINQIEKAVNRLYNLPIYVDDNPTVSMSYIRSRCKQLHKQGKCGLIMVDYLQLGQGDKKEPSREQEVAKMSRMAKITAKELGVPFILLSQLNRGSETRMDKTPLLSDLRESGAIEQDADMVLFVHRPEYYGIVAKNKDTGMEEVNYGEIIIAKNRNGATGKVKFKHNGSLTKFFDYEHTQQTFSAGDFDEQPF